MDNVSLNYTSTYVPKYKRIDFRLGLVTIVVVVVFAYKCYKHSVQNKRRYPPLNENMKKSPDIRRLSIDKSRLPVVPPKNEHENKSKSEPRIIEK